MEVNVTGHEQYCCAEPWFMSTGKRLLATITMKGISGPLQTTAY